MSKRAISLVWGLAVLIIASPALADELGIGAGYSDYPDQGEDKAVLFFEYRRTPFLDREVFSLAFAAAVSTTEVGDWYAGAGLAARWEWRSRWFVDASLLAGLHEHGVPGNDLGSLVNFRSLFGIGYTFGNGQRLSLVVTHISNAGLDDHNPGADALMLRYQIPLK